MSDLATRWQTLSADVISGMLEWRAQHPGATFNDIETALDTRLFRLRAQMLQDTALTSPAADWTAAPPETRPQCPACAQPLIARGAHPRHLQTLGGQELTLPRRYGTCPTCDGGVFPPRRRTRLTPR